MASVDDNFARRIHIDSIGDTNLQASFVELAGIVSGVGQFGLDNNFAFLVYITCLITSDKTVKGISIFAADHPDVIVPVTAKRDGSNKERKPRDPTHALSAEYDVGQSIAIVAHRKQRDLE